MYYTDHAGDFASVSTLYGMRFNQAESGARQPGGAWQQSSTSEEEINFPGSWGRTVWAMTSVSSPVWSVQSTQTLRHFAGGERDWGDNLKL